MTLFDLGGTKRAHLVPSAVPGTAGRARTRPRRSPRSVPREPRPPTHPEQSPSPFPATKRHDALRARPSGRSPAPSGPAHPQKAARAPRRLLRPWAASEPQPHRVLGPRPSGARLRERTAGRGPPSLPPAPHSRAGPRGGRARSCEAPAAPAAPEPRVGAQHAESAAPAAQSHYIIAARHLATFPPIASPAAPPPSRAAARGAANRRRLRPAPSSPRPPSLTERRAAMTRLARGRGSRGGGGGGEVRVRARRPGRGSTGVRPPVGPRRGHELAVSSR